MTFDSDAASFGHFEEHRDELRRRAKEVFRRFIDYQLRLRRAGDARWVECWQWPDAVHEVLGLPLSSLLVQRSSTRLHFAAQPWSPERYDDTDMFERLIDQFEDALADAADEP